MINLNIVPTVIEKSSNKEYAYDLYSRLLKDRIIFITGEINSNLSNIVVSELLYLDSINHNDISIYINSPGGEITSGLAIYDTINYKENKTGDARRGIPRSRSACTAAHGETERQDPHKYIPNICIISIIINNITSNRTK